MVGISLLGTDEEPKALMDLLNTEVHEDRVKWRSVEQLWEAGSNLNRQQVTLSGLQASPTLTDFSAISNTAHDFGLNPVALLNSWLHPARRAIDLVELITHALDHITKRIEIPLGQFLKSSASFADLVNSQPSWTDLDVEHAQQRCSVLVRLQKFLQKEVRPSRSAISSIRTHATISVGMVPWR